jgi:predicted site-specific integrase-resolvase
MPDDRRKLVTARTAVRLVGIGRTSLLRWAAAGRLTVFQVEGVGTPRYDLDQVQALADELANLDVAA